MRAIRCMTPQCSLKFTPIASDDKDKSTDSLCYCELRIGPRSRGRLCTAKDTHAEPLCSAAYDNIASSFASPFPRRVTGHPIIT